MDFSLVASQNRGNYFLLQKTLGSVAFTVKEEKKIIIMSMAESGGMLTPDNLEQKGVCLC